MGALIGTPCAFYYGTGKLDRLARHERVVLQPDAYSQAELMWLRQAGTQPLAYLSLSEDEGPAAPWQRDERNPDWGGALVVISDQRWIDHVVWKAAAALRGGFSGLFLDQLNVEFTHPEEIPDLLKLIGVLRALPDSGYILANRGLAMLPALADYVDGILFESFSARWVGAEPARYAPWPEDILDAHAALARQVQVHDVDTFALDYADAEELAEFARARAEFYGMPCFVSDRALSLI